MFECRHGKTIGKVTILILIDGFLQYMVIKMFEARHGSHNPYFNRWFSAMKFSQNSVITKE